MKYILSILVTTLIVSCSTSQSPSFQAIDEEGSIYMVKNEEGFILDKGEKVCIYQSSFSKGWTLVQGFMKDTAYVGFMSDSTSYLVQYRIVTIRKPLVH